MQEATVAKPIDYVPGLDELADEIGAKPGEDTFGITLRGKSGRQYGLVGLMAAFVHHLEKAEYRIADLVDQAYELGIDEPELGMELGLTGDPLRHEAGWKNAAEHSQAILEGEWPDEDDE